MCSIGSGTVAKQINDNFYDRFIDESALQNIPDEKTKLKYWVLYFSFILFCLISSSLPTFVGYYFKHIFSIIMFIWYVLFIFLAALSFIKILLIDGKYKVFKNHLLFLLSLPYIILMIVMLTLPIFTTKFVPLKSGAFEVNFNPFFYFLFFLPIFFGYTIFIYYAFMKCFAKYVKKHK